MKERTRVGIAKRIRQAERFEARRFLAEECVEQRVCFRCCAGNDVFVAANGVETLFGYAHLLAPPLCVELRKRALHGAEKRELEGGIGIFDSGHGGKRMGRATPH